MNKSPVEKPTWLQQAPDMQWVMIGYRDVAATADKDPHRIYAILNQMTGEVKTIKEEG